MCHPRVVESEPSFVSKWRRNFLVVHHMLPEHLFFISWTPFIICNMWSFTVGTFGLLFFSVWASFVRVAFSTNDTLSFNLTVFGRMSKILAVITLLDRNGSTKLFHLEYYPSQCGHVMLLEIIASASAGSLNSI